MLWQIFSFEVKYWLKSWMLWIFLLIMSALFFFATATDNVTVGDALTNTYRNAPFVIQNFYSIAAFFALLMAAAFVNSAAARDFNFNTHQILFSTPVSRFDFLVGRFLGATLVSAIPMLGVSVGILAAKLMPWIVPERWGPVIWKAHLNGILVLAIPNAFIIAAILFAIAYLPATKSLPSLVALAYSFCIYPLTAFSRTWNGRGWARCSILLPFVPTPISLATGPSRTRTH
ncbi:MAG TPA: ABC transporter permease subunit [Candidatus Acidoferrum sp.]|nr:ABC transporter permease subunit [Candidatus Acidoferrum sp.]